MIALWPHWFRPWWLLLLPAGIVAVLIVQRRQALLLAVQLVQSGKQQIHTPAVKGNMVHQDQ